MEGDSPGDLRLQIAALGDRISRLEQALARAGIQAIPPTARETVPPPVAPPLSSPALGPHEPFPTTDWRAKTEALLHHPAAASSRDPAALESRIGAHFFNRIGILAVLIGMAWFLKFAFDNHWIGPLGRVIIGLLTGSAIIAWSERFRHRGYDLFSYSLKAIGTGVLYLALWAAYDVYHLIPAGAAFAAMILVTAWNGFISWIQNSELLALYAIVGGFITPVLTSTGENHQLVLFGYVLLLDVAVLALIALRPWSRLVIGAFLGTFILLSEWMTRFYADEVFVRTLAFFIVFIVLFAVAPLGLRSLREPVSSKDQALWDRRVLVLLPLANAAAGFGALYEMLDTPQRMGAHPWMAVLFAAFYLGILQYIPSQREERFRIFTALDLALIVAFLAIAIPLKAHGYWIATGWLAEGAALLWAARRLEMLLLRGLAIGVLFLGAYALTNMEPHVTGGIIINTRFGAYLAGIVAFAYVAWLSLGAYRTEGVPERQPTDWAWVLQWRHLAGAAIVMTNLLILTAVSLEIHAYWMWRQSPEWMYEQFSYSVWWMLLGAMLLVVGFWKRTAFLRWQGLLLLACSILKVFVVDTSALRQGYRILSFLALGALLLAVSFAYQRDWLGLRTTDASEPPRS